MFRMSRLATTAPAFCARARPVRHRPRRQPDPGLSERRPLFRTGSAIDQHQRLWRLAAGDRTAGRCSGIDNQLVAGFSFDGAQTLFGASTQIGGLVARGSGVRRSRHHHRPGRRLDRAGSGGRRQRLLRRLLHRHLRLHRRSCRRNVAGRFNFAQIDLPTSSAAAHRQPQLSADSTRPAGLTYKILPGLSVYASYADANRAPTPAELTCASAASPCSLANFFVADPESAAGRLAHGRGRAARRVHTFRRCDRSAPTSPSITRPRQRHPVRQQPDAGPGLLSECRQHAAAGRRSRSQAQDRPPARLARLFLYRRRLSRPALPSPARTTPAPTPTATSRSSPATICPASRRTVQARRRL